MSSWVMAFLVVRGGMGSDEPPAQADRDEGGQGQERERAAGEQVRDLLLPPVRGDLGAEPLVHLVERVGVLGGVGAATGGPGDLGERPRVGHGGGSRWFSRVGAAGGG